MGTGRYVNAAEEKKYESQISSARAALTARGEVQMGRQAPYNILSGRKSDGTIMPAVYRGKETSLRRAQRATMLVPDGRDFPKPKKTFSQNNAQSTVTHDFPQTKTRSLPPSVLKNGESARQSTPANLWRPGRQMDR